MGMQLVNQHFVDVMFSEPGGSGGCTHGTTDVGLVDGYYVFKQSKVIMMLTTPVHTHLAIVDNLYKHVTAKPLTFSN